MGNTKEIKASFKLYRGDSLVGQFRSLEAAMVATGGIGLRFEPICDNTQWISTPSRRYLIVKEP